MVAVGNKFDSISNIVIALFLQVKFGVLDKDSNIYLVFTLL